MKQLKFAHLEITTEAVVEMTDFLVQNGYLILDKREEGFQWYDTKEYIGERKNDFKKEPNCPDCGRRHSGVISGCNMVYGRRGWRQLGEYDS